MIGPLTIICSYLAGMPCLSFCFGPLSVMAMYLDYRLLLEELVETFPPP